MTAEPWRYGIRVVREDQSVLGPEPIEIDWDPVIEWARLAALSRPIDSARALGLEIRIEPLWLEERGAPYVRGVRVTSADPEVAVALTVESSLFGPSAQRVVDRLVDQGQLEDGEQVQYFAVAFAGTTEAPPAPRANRIRARVVSPSLPIGGQSLAGFVGRTAPATDRMPPHCLGELPVFFPPEVLAEGRQLARGAEGRETGGLLLGHLHRDPRSGLLIEVTAQLPARHVDATATKLTFTSETWTEFRMAMKLRKRDEIILGWWHSHPVREWCKACPEERQRRCALRAGFLSADDRLLHRTMFPRAYSLALVVNDVGYGEPTVSLFGWRQGALTERAYQLLKPGAGPGGAPPQSRPEEATVAT